MKKIFTLAFVFTTIVAHSQLLTWTPQFPSDNSSITITMNGNYGNQGLAGFTGSVYMHWGVITNLSTDPSDWRYVTTTWGTTTAPSATRIGTNKWIISINNPRTYFAVPAGETILAIALLFRTADGDSVQRNADGSDMYVPIYTSGQLFSRIDVPISQPEYYPIPVPITKTVGDALQIVARASLTATTDSMQILFNGTVLSTVSGAKLSADTANTTITAYGSQVIIAKAYSGAVSSSDTLTFYVTKPTTIAALPAGVSDGINYGVNDSSVTLVLYAPNKHSIVVTGDFNNWTPSPIYQMNKTPDSLRYWVTINGLIPGTQYAYQYLIDDSLQLADYNTELVLDKNVDQEIKDSVPNNYPNLKTFPAKASGTLASVIQTGQTPYPWQVQNFTRPDKRNLVIYELLVRDFIATQNWQTLTDTLHYLKQLGINAIEVMPFCNFEGFSSWGYNPNFYFAPDKVYGTPAALKHFVDVCHQQGMAVIMDLVMNDVFGSSPLCQMYWNSALNVPASNNPWLDQYPTHPFAVGYQFNHQSSATVALRNRIYDYWLNNYHLDGFRFDLAKGYTQTQSCSGTPGGAGYCSGTNDVSNWGNYDQTRVNIWDSIYKHIQATSPGSYAILEFFGNDQEQSTYTNQGMMVWGGTGGNGGTPIYTNYEQASMSYNSSPSWNLQYAYYGWAANPSPYTQPGIINYQESHDQQRIMYDNENFGNTSGSYSIKTKSTGLQRCAMMAAFWSMTPGPLMMYEFEELGYDYSITLCSDGTTNTSCNTDPKPIRWDYYDSSARKALYTVYSKLLSLREVPNFANTFTAGTYNSNFYNGGDVNFISASSDSLQVMVYGNFDVASQSGTITYPSTGTWYEYVSNNPIGNQSISVASTSVTLAPGEYHVFINRSDAGILESYTTYTFNGSGNWTDPTQWLNNAVPPATLPANNKIIVNPVLSGKCTLNATQTISPNATFTIMPNANLVIPGNLSIQ